MLNEIEMEEAQKKRMESLRNLERQNMARKVQESLDKNRGPQNWTIMVYMAGDNNLAEEMVYALKCMVSVGTRDRYKIFAFFDAGLDPVKFPIPTRTERLEILDRVAPREKNINFAQGPVTENHELLRWAEKELWPKGAYRSGTGEIRSVQFELENFIKDCICDAPASHYMLVLSGHGSGSVGDFLAARKRFTGLSIPDLRETFKNVKESFREIKIGDSSVYNTIDILGLDSCQMSTAEVAYDVREHVRFLVGAEGFEPNTGWPYDQMLARLNERIQEATIEGAASQAIQPIGKKTIQEMLKLANEAALNAALTAAGEALLTNAQKRIVETAALAGVARAIAEGAAASAADAVRQNVSGKQQIKAIAREAAWNALAQATDEILFERLKAPEGNQAPTVRRVSVTAAAAQAAVQKVAALPEEASKAALEDSQQAITRAIASGSSQAEILESAEGAALKAVFAVLRNAEPKKESLEIAEQVAAKANAWKAVALHIADRELPVAHRKLTIAHHRPF